ncbi:unnamed protein product [Kluyveromyces dobzhanskii CBS 2104]|uniref:WGS project CCBQ000000000 data, contig 00098 n=1 Tax=Kluyveromyces dobzhanskii CBS 2104 TaxID=1427455 RepID=A0A0A8L5D8_9SACH|nr:unnamed protein product [Kluyveromyces dobzhanskii CBS 2104]
MDTALQERVDRLGRVLGGEERNRDDKFMARWTEKLSRMSSRVSKYRYRTRTVPARFAQSLKLSLKPYERVVDTLDASYRGIDVFSRDEFHKALEETVRKTRLEPVCWDSKYVNPVTIVSHGLCVDCCDGSVVTLACKSCQGTLSMDLSDSDLNEQYEPHLRSMHGPQCFWRQDFSVPLELVYYVNKTTVIYEIERIRSQWAKFNDSKSRFESSELNLKFDVPRKMVEMAEWFSQKKELERGEMALLYVLLRGYAPVETGPDSEVSVAILQCVGSYVTAVAEQVVADAEFNVHPNWSSHYDQDLILDLIYDTLIETPGDSVQDRMSRLRRIVSQW